MCVTSETVHTVTYYASLLLCKIDFRLYNSDVHAILPDKHSNYSSIVAAFLSKGMGLSNVK